MATLRLGNPANSLLDTGDGSSDSFFLDDQEAYRRDVLNPQPKFEQPKVALVQPTTAPTSESQKAPAFGGFAYLSLAPALTAEPQQEQTAKPELFIGGFSYLRQVPEPVETAKGKKPGFVSDVGNLAGIGVNYAAQDVRELVGKIPGVGKSIVKTLDSIDEWASGKPSEELLKENVKQAQGRLSPEMQAAGEKKWWDSDKNSFGSAWADPRSYVSGLVTSLPEQAMTMIPVMRLAKGVYASKIAAGVAPEAAAAASARAATVAGGVGEGLLGGAQASRKVRDEILTMSEDRLKDSEAMQALLEQGASFEQARAQLADDSSTQAFLLAGVTTGVFGGIGDRILAKAITQGIGKSVAGRAFKGAVAEGALEEFPQSYTQAVAENVAKRRADPSIEYTEDALNQGLGGLAVGAIQGGGMAAAFGRKESTPQADLTADRMGDQVKRDEGQQVAGGAGQSVQVPADGELQTQQINSAGFVQEPVEQVQAQIDAVREGRKPVVVTGQQEAAEIDSSGLQRFDIADPQTGEVAVVFGTDPQIGEAAQVRANEVGLRQAMGELLGFAEPNATTNPAPDTVVVQQVDNQSNEVIDEQAVSAANVGSVQSIPGTTPQITTVDGVITDRQDNVAQEQGTQQTADSGAQDSDPPPSPAVQAALDKARLAAGQRVWGQYAPEGVKWTSLTDEAKSRWADSVAAGTPNMDLANAISGVQPATQPAAPKKTKKAKAPAVADSAAATEQEAAERWEDDDDGKVAHIPWSELSKETKQQVRDAVGGGYYNSEKHDQLVMLEVRNAAKAARNARIAEARKNNPEADGIDLKRSATEAPTRDFAYVTASTINQLERGAQRALDNEGKGRTIRLSAVPVSSIVNTMPGLGVIERAAKLFGKKVKYFKVVEGSGFFDGAVMPGTDTIFINVNATYPHLRIFGHELVHAIKNAHPETYQRLKTFLIPMLNEKGMADFALKQKEWLVEDQEVILEEAIGDIVGDRFGEQEFWKLMASENPSLFRQIADIAIEFLDGLLKKLGLKQSIEIKDINGKPTLVLKNNDPKRTLGSSTLVNDIVRVRNDIASVLSDLGEMVQQEQTNRQQSVANQSVAKKVTDVSKSVPATPAAKNNLPAFKTKKISEGSTPQLFSALAKEVGAIQINSAQTTGWKDAIKGLVNKGKVKSEEIEWSGINDWLDLQKGKVSKEQVSEYLKNNGVRVEEVVLKDEPIEGNGWESVEGGARYGQYTLPGGENYREVLLTLPHRGDYQTPNGAIFTQEELADPVVRRVVDKIGKTPVAAYQSHHWNQPNVLAHIRVNDRTDADGNKVLFVEEIQSDWAQEGRKKGFNGKDPLAKNSNGDWIYTRPDGTEFNLGPDIDEQMMRSALGSKALTVPAAPFVTKTEGWLNLALKRIMSMAIESGYDKVAFVNGEQSAQRYDLSKQVDSITYEPTAKGYYINVMADGRNIKNGDFTASELENIVGKELVQKMEAREGEAEAAPGTPDYEYLKDVRILSGLDLKVGGEGMKAFYDKIVPAAVSKLTKKLGGQTGSVEMERGKPSRAPSEATPFLDWMASKHPEVKRVDAARAWSMGIDNNSLVQEYHDSVKRMTQPGIIISDQMRESVSQGLPMFRRAENQTFYSALEQAFKNPKISLDKNGATTGQQWKAWLNSKKAELGVKSDEIEWTGINDWFDLNSDQKLTGKQVLEWTAGNRVNVNDILLRSYGKVDQDLGPVADIVEPDEVTLREFVRDRIDEQAEEDREFGLSPDDMSVADLRGWIAENVGWNNFLYQYRRQAESFQRGRMAKMTRPKHNGGNLVLKGGANYAELVLFDPSIASYAQGDETHYGDVARGQAIGWIRMNERKDNDGNDVLFLEELQSKRAQDLRKGEQVPDAPFIKKTESWTALLIKRAVAYAQQRGIDRVVWTTGEQQNDRYKFPGDELVYAKNADKDTFTLTVNKGGTLVRTVNNVPAQNLSAYVGEETAAAIESGKLSGVLKGDDLKIMEANLQPYYNQTVPSVAKKFLKEFGGTVEVMNIEGTGQQLGFVIPKSLQSKVEEDGLPMFKRRDYEAQFSDLPTNVRDMAVAKGYYSPPTIKDRLQSLRPNMWRRVIQGTFDKFHSVKDITMKGYMMLRMSTSTDGALEGLLHYGQVFDDGGALNVRKGTKGLLEILKPVGGEVDRFLLWIAANRAAQLKKEDRENFFTQQEIDELTKINLGKMKDGKYRAGVYAETLTKMNELNRSVLELAKSKGLINEAGFKKFSNDIWYIPFYRVMEGEGTLAAAQTSSGAVNQYLSKKLKGSTRQINDLMENVLLNWSHILSASMKNSAAVETLQAATAVGAATKLTKVDSKFGVDSNGSVYPLKYAVKVMESGEEAHYNIEDEFLLASLDAATTLQTNGFWMNTGRAFKTTLTRFISLSPTFKINNLIRDSIQSIGISELKANPLANVWQGWRAYKDDRAEALVGGGLFAMGNAYDGDRAQHVKRLITLGVADADILTTPEKAKAWLTKFGEKYDDISDRAENANRLALYQQLRANGATHLEAAYAARDLQDFSLQGSWTAIRWAAMMLPYFNARMQGLYKLGRGAAENPQKFAAVSSVVTAIGLLLYLSQKDDDDWKKREEWDKDAFFWFKIGDKAVRIPKPFEMGAMATIIERAVEQIVDKDVEGKVFGKRLLAVLSDQLAINPIPQFIRPLSDIAQNKDGFTDRPIESMGQERLSPQFRVSAATSGAGIALGKVNSMFANFVSAVTGEAVPADKLMLSPIQYDYLLRGYLGWVGTVIQTTANVAADTVKTGESPDRKIDNMFVVGSYIKSLPQSQSRWVTSFYEQAKEIATATADYKSFLAAGNVDKAVELLEENRDKIALNKLYSNMSDKLSKVTKQINRVKADETMSGSQKRLEMDRLAQLRIEMAKGVEEARIAMKR